jgi:hypothetical protein
MSDLHGPTFATGPVAPGNNRRPLLVAALVVALVSGSFALARLTPGTDADLATPSLDPGIARTPRLSPTPAIAEVQPTATPLPPQEWFTAPEAPFNDVLVTYADSTRWLRLGNAVHSAAPLARPSQDLLIEGPHDGTLCLCWTSSGAALGDPGTLDLVRRGDDRPASLDTVLKLEDLGSTGGQIGPTRVALASSPDDRSAYLVRAVHSSGRWQVSLDAIDLVSASIVDTVELARPEGGSGEGTAGQPTIRIAPDGRHALIVSGLERRPPVGPPTFTNAAWIVDLEDQAVVRVVAADAIASAVDDAIGACSWIDFVNPSLIAMGCRYTNATAGASFEIRRFDTVGRTLSPIQADASQPDPGHVLIDTTAGIAYAWDPVGHSMFAADVIAGGWRSARPLSDERQVPQTVVVDGVRPSLGPPVRWSDGLSATDPAPARVLIGSPDGRLLFAVGAGPVEGSTSGIWVFDTRTLKLIERWPALATYDAITMFENGRFLAALGRPGVTANGGPAYWMASVTVHDATTGQAVVRIGDLGLGVPVGFPLAPAVASLP